MEARVWGCRGSLASPGADTVRYGGNTSCVEVRLESGHLLILDAGTGIRPLGAAMDDEPFDELHIFLTHLHLDHLQGLGFFRPLFRPGADIHIWGPAVAGAEPGRPDRDLPLATAVPGAPRRHPGPDHVPRRARGRRDDRLRHRARRERRAPGPDGRLPDRGERADARVPPGPRAVTRRGAREQPPSWISGHEVAHDADVLFHDAQYGDDEYPNHIGWGHSSIEHVMGFATKADVGMVILFHHDPYHTDDELEQLLVEARQQCEMVDDTVCLAHEGMTVALDRDGIRIS